METIIVLLAVGIASVLVGRTIYRTMAGKKAACACSEGCPLADGRAVDPPATTSPDAVTRIDCHTCLYETKRG